MKVKRWKAANPYFGGAGTSEGSAKKMNEWMNEWIYHHYCDRFSTNVNAMSTY